MGEEAKGKQKLFSLRKYNSAVKPEGRKNYFLVSQMKLQLFTGQLVEMLHSYLVKWQFGPSLYFAHPLACQL